MYWEITRVWQEEEQAAGEAEHAGRFVMHRHVDKEGPHLDLRLEHGDSLLGWRIAGESLEEGQWATEKMPHPVEWLSRNHGLERRLEGQWRWVERDETRCTVALWDGESTLCILLEACKDIQAEEVRTLAQLAQKEKIAFSALASLVEDGIQARMRAVARFCALSRTLDGEGFDEAGWRQLFTSMSFNEIGERLAKVEIRHDRSYPPQPVSEPELLEEEEQNERTRHAYHIIHS